MTLTDPMLLPSDVTIVPVHELPSATRELLGDGGYAVTRRHSRAATTIVDGQAAELLERFRVPTAIVDAVIAFSRAHGAAPAEVLEEAFPMLQRLLDRRIMVPAGSPEAHPIEPTLGAGDTLGPCTVKDCVQALDDSELYRADRDTVAVALKVLRPAAPVVARLALEHEGRVLRLLGGAPAPRLVADGSAEDPPHLVLEWIAGTDLARAAERGRLLVPHERAHTLLGLCRAVVRAYCGLHANGVLHGDVHPRNILVGRSDAMTLIDFGFSRVERVGWDDPPAGRGGVGFFFEPELARRERSGQPPPAVTAAGEQYAVAALLYLILTGSHYTEFPLDREAFIRQIETAPPEPFTRRGLEPWPDVERALGRALSKDPDDRYESLAQFSAALEAAEVPEWLRPTGRPRRAGSFVDDVLGRLLPAAERVADEPLAVPTCSLSYGAAGSAYALLRLARLRDDPALLAAADVWAERAARESARPEAFVNAELEITPDIVGTVSPYHTVTGVHLVQAMIAAARADAGALGNALDRFVSCSRRPCANVDLTLGRSGTLVASALLFDSLPMGGVTAEAQRATLLALGNDSLAEVWAELGPRTVGAPGGPEYLGVAHGWAGVLYATLLWCACAGVAMPPPVAERLAELAALEGSSGGWWPITVGAGEAGAMPGWCHGSAGYAQLWLLAADALGDDDLTETALRAARRAVGGGGGVGSLCCGLAGRAYAALAAYRRTGEREWARSAVDLTEAAANGLGYWGAPPGSLYKGDLGAALLAAECEYPERATMPLFGRG